MQIIIELLLHIDDFGWCVLLNRVDLIILCITLLSMIIGCFRGLIKSVLSVIQYFAVIILSIVLAPFISSILIQKFNVDLIIINFIKDNGNLFGNILDIMGGEILKNIAGRIINVLAFIIVFVLLKKIFSLIIEVLNKIANLPILNVVNRLGGLILGAINGILIVYLFILLVNWLPFASVESLRVDVQTSLCGKIVSSYAPEVTSKVISLVKTKV